MLVEDDPYGLLRFEGDPVPTLHELDGGEHVIYCSSFTKTVAPGVRTGYLVLPERLVKPLAVLSENTYIGPNTLAEAVVCGILRRGPVRAQRRPRDRGPARPSRRDGGGADASTSPRARAGRRRAAATSSGSTLPDGIDTSEALAAAVEQGVPYVRGADFFAADGGRSSLRLAFSACATDQIDEGIARLAEVLASRRTVAVA